MKVSYVMMLLALCLNLGFWGVEQAGLYSSVAAPVTFDPTTSTTTMNATKFSRTITGSADPTGGTDYVNVGLGLFTTMFTGIFAGFPAFVMSIPYVPTYVGWLIVTIYLFIYSTFIIELAMGRDITG